MAYTLAQIAHIETDFSEKFGIPRQSGLVEELRARIVFEPEFRSPDAVRGLDGYDYIWLVWQFSTVVQAGQDGTNWRPTVRPPRLGGNDKLGVFASRSTFRPNPLGLSLVELLAVEPGRLLLAGADLVLSGHVHAPLCRPLAERYGPVARGCWTALAGTATSRRLRGGHPNSVNVIRHALVAGERRCSVERLDYDEVRGAFRPVAVQAMDIGG